MRTLALIPAYNNEATIGETVAALAADSRIDLVVVIDDGSQDSTGLVAAENNARCVHLAHNSGKGQALEYGLSELAGEHVDVWLLVDADTGASATGALALIEPVQTGEADMAIGLLPSAGSRAGFGIVKRLAAWLIKRRSGYVTGAPLSGQRAISARTLDACRPLGRGFGMDSLLTATAIEKGFRLVEIPVAIEHEHTGRGPAGFAHRARQGWHILRAFLAPPVK